MANEKPFRIAVPDDALALLQRKLADTRFPDEVEDANWAYGTPLADIKRLTERWRGDYDWRAHERRLNEQLPMFTRDIEVDGFGTVNVHYVHKRSSVAGAIPLIYVHGWPGNFAEVSKILPLLTAEEPGHPSFHVVAPSLPGYGWSEGILKPGFQGKNYAELFNKLMISLGYSEYVTQGGDWGFVLTRYMAARHGPKHVKASHTNATVAPPITFRNSPLQYFKYLLTPYTEIERKAIERENYVKMTGMGYFAQQSTRPQTIGYALADSPVGWLAWIYEKLVSWTDEYPWTDDEVITWISIYWFSRAGPAASLRIYYEIANSGELFSLPRTSVPVGISCFPKELFRSPRAFVHAESNIVFESEHAAGGHFPAYEKPEALVDDLRRMFGRDGPAAGVVSGRIGY
ncbi:Alpha/Beta hydrolase protein [Gloeopeniophorella convolvens]|nr:Alpha/Beta hydrolase protein [Gloeopeniophorella convolvens]